MSELFADPKEAPHFANIDKPGHDMVERLETCLDLQLKALFDNSLSYPGQVAVDDTTMMCDDIATAYSDVGIPGCVFDQFITDATIAMKIDGVPDDYIPHVAPVLTGLKSTIASTILQYLGSNTVQNCK